MQQFLAALPLLACPVAMGVMMWWMSRNRGDHAGHDGQLPDQTAKVSRLRAEVEQLRAAHEARTRTAEQNTRGNP